MASIEAIGKAYKKNKVVLLSVKEKQGSSKTLDTPSVSEIRSPRDGAQNGKTPRGSEKKTEKEKEKGTKKDKKKEKGKSAKKQDTAEKERAEKEREKKLEQEREYEQERIRKEKESQRQQAIQEKEADGDHESKKGKSITSTLRAKLHKDSAAVQPAPPSTQPAATVPPLELDSIFLGVMTPTIASKSLVRTCLFPPPANSKYC